MSDRFRQEPRQREYEDPDESVRPLPRGFIVLMLVMGVWGSWYIFGLRGASDPTLGDRRTLAALAAAPAGAADGAQIFSGKCAACHQANGQGVPGVFPSLAGVDYVTGSPERLVQILLHGIQGPLDVNGVTYNGLMPAWNSLPDEEIAAVASYIRSSWGNSASAITVNTVADERVRTASRTSPWLGSAGLADFSATLQGGGE